MIKGFFLWLMNTPVYKFFLRAILPYIRFSLYYPELPGWKYHMAYSALLPGDIILTVDRKKLSSVLIPGVFSHAAVCVGKSTFPEVVEMTHEDYHKTMFFDLCKESDRVVILRCVDFDEAYTKSFIKKALSFEGATYDIHFSNGVKELYCSELVFEADFEDRLKLTPSVDKLTGLTYVSPDDLYRAPNMRIIFDSDSADLRDLKELERNSLPVCKKVLDSDLNQ